MRRPHQARLVLLMSLGVMSVNFASTGRWAEIPGSIRGPKAFVFLALLVTAFVLAVLKWPQHRPPIDSSARVFGVCAVVGLAGLFLYWFPLELWSAIPFLDNWPARYLSTIQGIDLLSRGAFVGWNWSYLGGYHLSSDVTQSLAVLAYLPVTLFGGPVGFHVLHLALFLALPLLTFIDLADEDDETRYIATGVTAVAAAGFSYLLLRSGDTNSLAGVACTQLAFVASHAAARGLRWGGGLLVGSLALLNYVHAGFVVYAGVYLALEALFYRDRDRFMRLIVAGVAALVAGLPLYWESWLFPDYFIPNNVIFEQGTAVSWSQVLRKVYYNVELLWLPGRWFNDFGGLSTVLLPVMAFVAWHVRSRAGFYAWVGLVTIGLLRLNTPEFAYLFLRPIHVLAVVVGPVLAVFLSRFVARRALVAAVVALSVVYLQIYFVRIPHVQALTDADPVLIERLSGLDGALVLVENTPHRDMDADPTRSSEPTPFAAHLEQVFGVTTGQRLYAGLWDGWQWSPARDQVLAGGAFRGRALETVPVDQVTDELRKWGVRHLVVWSDTSRRYLESHPMLFVERWSHGAWHEFEYLQADPRSVTTAGGEARVLAFDPLSAQVELAGVPVASEVIVRTNYHPSWKARVPGRAEAVPLFDRDGQLAFLAPVGTGRVELVYPRAPWLSIVAAIATVTAAVAVTRWRSPRPGRVLV